MNPKQKKQSFAVHMVDFALLLECALILSSYFALAFVLCLESIEEKLFSTPLVSFSLLFIEPYRTPSEICNNKQKINSIKLQIE